MGYGGFGRFRNIVAETVSKQFCSHYLLLSEASVMFLSGDENKKYFEKYNAITEVFVDKGEITVEVANFLFQSDCGGKIDKKQAQQIYELIKDCNDDLIFGYVGRSDCAKMSDMKKIFSDKTKVKWY